MTWKQKYRPTDYEKKSKYWLLHKIIIFWSRGACWESTQCGGQVKAAKYISKGAIKALPTLETGGPHRWMLFWCSRSSPLLWQMIHNSKRFRMTTAMIGKWWPCAHTTYSNRETEEQRHDLLWTHLTLAFQLAPFFFESSQDTKLFATCSHKVSNSHNSHNPERLAVVRCS